MFGIYVGLTMAMAIILDNDGEHPWYASWFVTLAGGYFII